MSARDRARKRDAARRRDLVAGKGGEHVELHLEHGVRHELPTSRIVVLGVQHMVIGGGRMLEDRASLAAYRADMTMAGRNVPRHGPVHVVPSHVLAAHASPSPTKRVYKTPLHARLRRRELRSEREDAVRCNLDPQLLLWFEGAKDSIRLGAALPAGMVRPHHAVDAPRRSWTEAVVEYAEAHPGEVWDALQRHADARVEAMVRQRGEQRDAYSATGENVA